MNNRQLKKRYKKLYDFDFIKKKIKEVFPTGIYKIKIAFYYSNIVFLSMQRFPANQNSSIPSI